MKIPVPRKLKSGTWFIQLRLGGESIPITANDDKECIKQAQYVKAEYLAGKRQAKSEPAPTLGEAIDTYISSRSNVLSPATVRGYNIIRKNRFQAMMDREMTSITDAEWITACNAEAALCSAKTLINSWRFIASVLRENRVAPPRVALPQIPPNERPFLDAEQIKIFIKAVKGTEVEIAALLALSSLRRSEVLALDWADVDLKKKRLHVRSATVPDENNKMVRKKETKNRTSTRYVPIMIDELYDALKVAQGNGPVVSVHHETMRKRINAICADNSLPEVGVHGLRHSFASLAYHLGVPEKITMEIGGWADNQTMRKIYTHVAKSDITRYETKLADFYKNANENANSEIKT